MRLKGCERPDGSIDALNSQPAIAKQPGLNVFAGALFSFYRKLPGCVDVSPAGPISGAGDRKIACRPIQLQIQEHGSHDIHSLARAEVRSMQAHRSGNGLVWSE